MTRPGMSNLRLTAFQIFYHIFITLSSRLSNCVPQAFLEIEKSESNLKSRPFFKRSLRFGTKIEKSESNLKSRPFFKRSLRFEKKIEKSESNLKSRPFFFKRSLRF